MKRLYTKVVIGGDGISRKQCAAPDCPFGIELLPLDFFSPNAQVKSGVQARCHICEAKNKREWRKNNPGKSLQSSRLYAAQHRDEAKARRAKWALANIEKRRRQGRELKRKTAAKIKMQDKEKLLSDPNRHWTRRTITRCKNRAKQEGSLFNIEASDILPLPEFCSVFGIKLDYFGGPDRRKWASVDRIIPALGYVKGNVRIISQAANWAKSNGDGDLIKLFSLERYPTCGC